MGLETIFGTGVITSDALDRSTPLLVDGRTYSESRLVHVTLPVDTQAAHVVGAHEPQGVYHWEGEEHANGH